MTTARALFWLLASAAALRALGYQRAAERWLRADKPTRRGDARAEEIARAVHRAARLLRPRPSCLSRALAGARLLARDGLDARVTIGVAPGAPAAPFAAHAWLTHGPLVLAGGGTARDYAPLCAIDAASHPAFTTLR